VRPTHVTVPQPVIESGPDGIVHVRDARPLGHYPGHLTERLDRFAAEAPNRPYLAARGDAGAWLTLTYADVHARVRGLTQALLDRGLSDERPIVVLSGNSLDHALLALAAMYGGVPYAPISPAYSLQTRDFAALTGVFERMRPGLVFAAGKTFETALARVVHDDVEVVSSGAGADRASASIADLCRTTVTDAVDRAHGAVTPDTIAKVLFTSGSTGRPKGVINTHGMLCSNQEMLRAVFGFLADTPPVLCDWLPWNHTAGGNHNFGMALYNGGTLYLDEGRPTPDGIHATVRNLRDVAATAHFTVPRTYESLLPFLRRDRELRDRFFSRLEIFFYAAAGLNQRHMDELQALAVETTGDEILWVTGLGATETAPFALSTGSVGAFAGFVGFPVPGVELKLVTVGDKLEACVRGPSITPGYWRDAALTSAAFDDDGFYRMGDALRPVEPGDLSKGFIFDGRLTEDFKLSSGTWVSVGPLRSRVLLELGQYVQDVVITAPDRPFVGALLFPQLAACRALCPDLADEAPASTVCADPRVRQTLGELLTGLARTSTGTSTRVARALVVDVPPSIDRGEVTDKGSLNQKVILRNRADLVDELYAAEPSSRTLAV